MYFMNILIDMKCFSGIIHFSSENDTLKNPVHAGDNFIGNIQIPKYLFNCSEVNTVHKILEDTKDMGP